MGKPFNDLESAERPGRIIREWLRNSAIAFVLIVGGLVFGGLVAEFLFGPRPGAGATACLFIGMLPLIWFANRKLGDFVTIQEYLIVGAVLTITELLLQWMLVPRLLALRLSGLAAMLIFSILKTCRTRRNAAEAV